MHTYIEVPCTLPVAYWDGWWDEQDARTNEGGEITHFLLRSKRTDGDGLADARILVERAASGLHFGLSVVWPAI